MTSTGSPQKIWLAPALWLVGFLLFAGFITWNTNYSTFMRYLLLGLPTGAIIALIAVGYSMVYGIIQLINFAHGDVVMFASFFLFMLVAPFEPEFRAVAPVITGLVALMAWCTAWVLTERWRSKSARWGISAVAALLFAAFNWYIMPKAGGTATVLPFLAAWLVAVVYAGGLGVTMDLLAYRPLRNSPRLIPLITAIGLSMLLVNVAQLVWGPKSYYYPASVTDQVFPAKRIPLPGIFGKDMSISLLDITVIVLAGLLAMSVQIFILKTRTGKAMRACAQDRATASLMGIEVNRIVALAFAIGAALAALVGPLYVLRAIPLSPNMGYQLGILAFASAVLGGIGNITGAMLGGLIIGIIWSFVPLFDALDTFRLFKLVESWGWLTKEGYDTFVTKFGRPGAYQLGVAYAFMILVIVFKPTGLLGQASARRA